MTRFAEIRKKEEDDTAPTEGWGFISKRGDSMFPLPPLGGAVAWGRRYGRVLKPCQVRNYPPNTNTRTPNRGIKPVH